MPSVALPENSSTSSSLDSPVEFSSAQASAYAHALLTSANVNPAAYKDALRRCQVALDKKTEEVEALKAELATLKVSEMISDNSSAAKTSRTKRIRGVADFTGTSVEKVERRMIKDVRALAATACLWLGDGSFQQPPLLSNPFPSARDRYLSDEALDFYHTYVLYSHFHVDYHAALEGDSLLRGEVQRILSQERSTLVKNIRKTAQDIFFEFPPIVAQAVSMREYARAREPECLRFLVPPNQVPSVQIRLEDPLPPVKYLDLPPILFPELDGTRAQEIFRSDVLIQIARCILFGERAPGRAVALKQGRTERNVVPATCLARQRHITKTTPGLIAAAAILGCFVVSGDTVFSEGGSITGAAYRSRYFKFKLLLEESQESGDSHTIATFSFWNQQLFGAESGGGEHFNFSSLNEDSEDELSSHRRAVMSQSQSSSTSMQADLPRPLSSASSARPINTSMNHVAPAESTSTSQSRPSLVRSQAVIIPSAPVSSGWSDTQSRSGGQNLPLHLSIMAGSSAPIAASQPGSGIYLNINENEGSDTASDSDVTPPASEPPISRSPTPTRASPTYPANDRALIEEPAVTQVLNPADVPPTIPNNNRPQNPRRGRPANRSRRSAQQKPGPSNHLTVQQDGVPAAAPPQMRSRLRNRDNVGKC